MSGAMVDLPAGWRVKARKPDLRARARQELAGEVERARFWAAGWSRQREQLRMRSRSLSVAAKSDPSMFETFARHMDRLAAVVTRLNRARARLARDLTGVAIDDPGHGRGRVIGKDNLFSGEDIWLIENDAGQRWGMSRARIEAAREC